MKIATTLPYAGNVKQAMRQIRDLESAGLDLVWVAEAYGFDAVSLLGYLAAVTETVELGSGILPIYTRTPTLTAMTAAGLDELSDGRFVLGLGASGPQVVEGFHGVAYDRPIARTREIVEICRAVWAREVFGPALDAGAAKRDPALGPLDVCAGGLVAIGEESEVAHVRDFARPTTALYVGGMGARGRNFYNALVQRYGYEAEAAEIQDLYLSGKKKEAEAAVPDELLELTSLVGPEGYIKERLAAFREAGVTVLNVMPIGPDPADIVEKLKAWSA